jgi:hypothetical protein
MTGAWRSSEAPGRIEAPDLLLITCAAVPTTVP